MCVKESQREREIQLFYNSRNDWKTLTYLPTYLPSSYKLAFFLPEKIVPMSAFDLCVCDDLPFCAMKKYRRGVHQTLCTYV